MIVYQSPPQGRFYIDNNNRLFTGDSLDREKIDTYQLLLRIFDRKAKHLISEKLITINVGDENDNMPECNDMTTFVIPKNAKLPLKFHIHCTDRDAGYNASVAYKVVNDLDGVTIDWAGNIIISYVEKPLSVIPFIAVDRTSSETR